MRFKLLVLLVLYAGTAHAVWTGISLELADYDSDWEFGSDAREAQINKLTFTAEEKTSTELRAGFNLGIFDMRTVGGSAAETKKFDGEFLGVFLRLPVGLAEHLALHGWFNYTYHSGRESGDIEDGADISWSEIEAGLGIGARFSNLRLMPYVIFSDIDGDVRDDEGTVIFEQKKPRSQGLRVDYFLEPTAYIRFEFTDGGQFGGYLTFVREY